MLSVWPSVLPSAPQEHESLTILSKKQKKICNLVLVDELQAGLADGDIYLSVYLKEVWFKLVSLDLFYLLCVCVCVCVRGTSCPDGFSCPITAQDGQRPAAHPCLSSALKAQKKGRSGKVSLSVPSHPATFFDQGGSSCLRVRSLPPRRDICLLFSSRFPALQ